MAVKKEPAAPAPVVSDKKKALETAMQQIEKMYGKGSIMRYGAESTLNVESIPTGSLSLDLALGIGGLPRGRIVEIYGPESSGKTTLALHVLAEAQKMGGEVAFVDAEHALDPTYAKALGVNVEDMLISQPDTGEQALEITEALVRSGAIDVVVVDSVAALVPRAEIEGEMGDSFVGLHARLMSQALRKLTGVIAKTNSIVIFINQLREKVGVMYGNPEVTTGGRALKFYASVRIDVRRIEALKSGGEIIKNIITNLNITGGALGLDTSSIYAGAKDLLPYGAVLVLLTVAVMLNLKRSKYGRAIMAIRDNRIAAESVGLNVTWYKLAVFVIAAFFAGCAGVLYGHSLANIKAAAFDYNMSIEILVIVVLGGMGSVPGSVISAIVLTVLPEALREVADYRMLVYAIVLILVMQATNNPTMKRFFASAKEKLTPGRKERAAL